MANYYCVTCGKQANKPACEKEHPSLGTWRCDQHGPTKVTRKMKGKEKP